MMELAFWATFINIFIGLMAIVNPVGILPIFLSITNDQTPEERQKTGTTACIAVGIILLVSMLAGSGILKTFSISLDSFRVAGGILVMLIAYSQLQAKGSKIKHTEEEDRESVQKDNVSVVPLALPIMAGPGSISSIILWANESPTISHKVATAFAIVALAIVAAAIFRAAPFINKLLGITGLNVVTRIMGLILFAIGIELMASGLKGLFPALTYLPSVTAN
ncbi:YchE family NAAT transporter [Corallincola platygyrae]|uniref:UPF0056 membrane protein n=1 Tax=Corallincola platygyrae TaxID=1193278 RepID=A0ABW4XN59_9GAMM